jgi:hypothetical protein
MPKATGTPRIPRDRRDDRYDAQGLMPRKAAGAGYVTSVQDDTVTVNVTDQDVSGVIFLHDKPPVGSIVEIETRGDLTVIPRWFEHPPPLVGSAQEFSPADDSYLYPVAFDDNNTDWSVEFLYKLRSNPPQTRIIAQTSNGVALNQSWHLFVDPSGQILFRLKDLNTSVTDWVWKDSGWSGALADHKAHHVVIRYDKTAKRASVVVDNNEAVSVTIVNNYFPDRNLILGGSFFGSVGSPDGILDEVALYMKVLGAGEIGDHLAKWKSYGDYPAAVIASGAYSYLKLDEKPGEGFSNTLCRDEITGNNRGDLQGGAIHTDTPPLQWGK